ncbi:hypothetical protein FDG2_4745 [Candidatus Protofrankia californiensis]|uniref:Glycosyl transferase family 1 domain-containing protein n=1 Tax=Candidatus Protofrankia californiensis TaxID=1839754 RepID=A0A1C3P858_9ACTN|nr:hypothetical protein FDG2_4745 [Candidatus Protofrankia californiensis]
MLDRRSGAVVDGSDLKGITDAVGSLLADPDRARAMGASGRAWVEMAWRWDVLTARLRDLLLPSQ